MYGSGIKALDDLANEFDGNSQSTLGSLDSQVSQNSFAFGDVCVEDERVLLYDSSVLEEEDERGVAHMVEL
ncbi:hypothetical protein Tco_1005541 [Tanacetum coccineum]|uniref:Uncharacterized protein n=1 Tax=Tanacetum coccineum TaxID=301880 RepID=A0ABQ5FFI4_9ASTR